VLRGALCSLLVLLALAGPAIAQVPSGEPPTAAPETLLIVETQTHGVEAIVGRYVERALRTQAQTRGYHVLGPEHARIGMEQLAVAYPPNMADLWRVTYRAQARYGVFAVVSADRGLYRVKVSVASREGDGPYYTEGSGTSIGLEAMVAGLLEQALPQPTAPNVIVVPTAEPSANTDAPAPAPPDNTPAPLRFFANTPNEPGPEAPRFRLALHNDLALGLAEDTFIANVLGARVDYRIGDRTWLEGHFGYANLPGRNHRVPGLLPYLQLEHRIPILPDGPVSIPLRLGLGYLLRNGSFMRLSSGLAFALSKHADLVLDLLTPTFWVTPSRTLFSLNLGVELSVTL
jgi:hypothetical protein